METKAQRKIDLLSLVLMVSLATGLLTFVNVFYATYQVQRTQLIEASLDSNYNYAKKLANSTDDFLVSAQKQIAMVARIVASNYADGTFLQAEAERLRLQTDSFNSVVFVDKHALVLATSPEALALVGKTSISEGVLTALRQRRPYISAPTLSSVGNFIVFISHPVLSAEGEYLGLVGGSLYLRQTSILNRLLGTHYYSDGSYLYVVTKDKQLIYHPDAKRVGEIVSTNPVIDELTQGGSGQQRVINSQGTEMLAGYAVIPTTGWGVVAQRPLAAAVAPLDNLMQKVMTKTIPLAILVLLLVWWCARQIAEPLRLLAEKARSMHVPETEENIRAVRSWYFESQELKNAMLFGMGLFKRNIEKLSKDVKTDPLTGLDNRRSLEAELRYHQTNSLSFAVISIDIDHFKYVNDTYGHDVGDLVLVELARLMQESSRDSDVPCRVGGEEFLVLLPGVDTKGAVQIAERLRQKVEAAPMPHGEAITISLGVASWPGDSMSIAAVLKFSDEMLYKAKRQGRNRVEFYHSSLETKEQLLRQAG